MRLHMAKIKKPMLVYPFFMGYKDDKKQTIMHEAPKNKWICQQFQIKQIDVFRCKKMNFWKNLMKFDVR